MYYHNRQEWLEHVEALKAIQSMCFTSKNKEEVYEKLFAAYIKSLDQPVDIKVLAEDAYECTYEVVGGTEPASTYAETLSRLEEETMTFEGFHAIFTAPWVTSGSTLPVLILTKRKGNE